MARRLKPLLRPRRRTLVLLAVGVIAVHAWLVEQALNSVADWSADATMAPRVQVAYVREMSPAAPPAPGQNPAEMVAAPDTKPPPRQRPPPPDRSPASAPAASEPATDVAAQLAAPLAPDMPEQSETVSAAAAPAAPFPAVSAPSPTPVTNSVAQASAAGASPSLSNEPVGLPSTAPFRWPASTRLSYRLTGQYRGEVHGNAQVEWILATPRYQVNMDVTVGLPFAPLYTRRMRSDGRLSAAGLQPERYEEDSKLAFRERRRVSLQLDSAGVLLADGQRWTRPPAQGMADPFDATVQDSASQFVQLSYLFTTEPQRLTPGNMIGFALALPRRVEAWFYEVVGPQTLYTPFGPLETFHVRPRRGTPRGNDLLAEAWFSPQLAYLPVRIRIEQDADTYIDLMIERKPELAAAPEPEAASAPR